MPDKEPSHNLSYRRDIMMDMTNYIQGGDSFFIIGAASMGKTRLIDFAMRADARRHYLSGSADSTWLIRVDLNRLYGTEEWKFYELVLSAMLLHCSYYEHADMDRIQAQLADLDSKVIESQDLLRALRFLELAINRLCQIYKLNLCFLFDEFDEYYRSMDKRIFAHLRALRDANKNRVSYGIFLRVLPESLRAYHEVESFRELFGSRVLGLRPYSQQDTLQVIQQQLERKGGVIAPEYHPAIFAASGGHPGMIGALIDLVMANPQVVQRLGDFTWLVAQKTIRDECEKLWQGLLDEERVALSALKHGNWGNVSNQTRMLLSIKGLIRNQNNQVACFTPLLEKYIP
jgi:hypothetical protein